MRWHLTEVERFWAKVAKGDSCWLWAAAIGSTGYGNFTVRRNRKTVYVRASRYSWELHFGPIPDGLFVCHSCDNRTCVNPAHLFLGSNKDNQDDMRGKGRDRGYAPGTRNCSVKLTADQVQEIRRLHSAGMSSLQIARLFPVRARQIRRIIAGERWGRAS
jgi:hypothetical protein